MIGEVTGSLYSSSKNRSDLEEFWYGIREGNTEALSQLYCISYSWLFNYGYKIIPRSGFVEDAIQELFLILWKKRTDINEAKSVRSYLFASLRRILFRRLQKQRNRTQRNHDYKDYQLQEAGNIEKMMIHLETGQERKEQLKNAMQSLSQRQKEAISLKYFDGLSNKEISQVMNINRQSVYNHVSTAINKMQEQVQLR